MMTKLNPIKFSLERCVVCLLPARIVLAIGSNILCNRASGVWAKDGVVKSRLKAAYNESARCNETRQRGAIVDEKGRNVAPSIQSILGHQGPALCSYWDVPPPPLFLPWIRDSKTQSDPKRLLQRIHQVCIKIVPLLVLWLLFLTKSNNVFNSHVTKSFVETFNFLSLITWNCSIFPSDMFESAKVRRVLLGLALNGFIRFISSPGTEQHGCPVLVQQIVKHWKTRRNQSLFHEDQNVRTVQLADPEWDNQEIPKISFWCNFPGADATTK